MATKKQSRPGRPTTKSTTTSTAGAPKRQCEYVRLRSQSDDELENEKIISDLEKNKTSLKSMIDNNREEIINLKEKNKDLLRQRQVPVSTIIHNEMEIEKLEKGIVKLESFGVRFYGL